ncbi:hypothetical protein SNEBB_010676 [Seison nebaliae]|nr:hypothetical protein SNEBB_010676 [Seison nebaliae]
MVSNPKPCISEYVVPERKSVQNSILENSLPTERIVQLYKVSNYIIKEKEQSMDPNRNVNSRYRRLIEEYEKTGMRRSVDIVLLLHQFGMPHVVLLQAGRFYKLPGGELKPEEGVEDGTIRILKEQFYNCKENDIYSKSSSEGSVNFVPCETIANWWRTSFDPPKYPYLPPHSARPKEHTRVILVEMDKPHGVLYVPKNYKFMPIPLFSLMDNSQQYGQLISSLPISLSRFHFQFN